MVQKRPATMVWPAQPRLEQVPQGQEPFAQQPELLEQEPDLLGLERTERLELLGQGLHCGLAY